MRRIPEKLIYIESIYSKSKGLLIFRRVYKISIEFTLYIKKNYSMSNKLLILLIH